MSVIITLDQLRDVVDQFLEHDSFQFDIETVPIDAAHDDHRGDPRRNRMVWLSMATTGLAVAIPFGHPNGDFVRLEFPLTPAGEKRAASGKPPLKSSYSKDVKKAKKIFEPPPPHLRWCEDVREILEPLFFSDRLKINHNIKFDLESIAKHFGGRIPPPPYACTLIAGFLLDMRNKGFLSLDQCVKREIEYPMVKGVGKRIEDHSFDEVAKYSYLDAKYSWLLWQEYERQIAESDLGGLWRLEMDVLETVVAMEDAGAPIDPSVLQRIDVMLTAKMETLKAEIYRLAGKPFNINSNRQVQQILFTSKKEGGRGLRGSVLTDGGKKRKQAGEPLGPGDYSVAAKALERFSSDAFVRAYLDYADAKDLHGDFVIKYLGGEVEKTTGDKTKIEVRESLLINSRIHASFNQIGTETGRFSSKSPNLQQVPARSAEGKMIRAAFTTRLMPGFKLVVADYSQIEPRILADQSGSEKLIAVYRDGGDIYTTLAEPFGLDRDAGKVLVLSIAYGTGPDKLATTCNISLKDAKNIIYDEFPKAFPEVDRLKKRVIAECKRRKPCHVRTILGRRRYLPELFAKDEGLRRRAERQAFNALIQGSAADMNKVGLVRVHKMIPPEAQLILTVHDEVVVTTPESLAEETATAVREAMEGVRLLKNVELVAGVTICDDWSQGK